MGFSQLERIQLAAKDLIDQIRDGDVRAQWYESTQRGTRIIPGGQVWLQIGLLRSNPAAGPGPSTAQALAAGTLNGVVSDLSTNPSAVRLTPVPAVNNTYIALSTYNDFSSAVLDNWVSPHLVPLTTGNPSTAYTIRLYNGNPTTADEITTTDGTTGTGENKTVGWFFDYASGILITSSDFEANLLSQTGITWAGDPYVLGFRYIGDTADASLLSESEHEDLDTLVHNLAETSWTEYLYTGKNLTSTVTWDSSANNLRVRDTALSYTGKNLTQLVTRQYAPDGSTVVQTLTSTFTYVGKDLTEVDTVES